MRPLTQADLLTLWEEGRWLHPLDQGVIALEAAFPGERAVDWPLGRRNRALADFRCAVFGPTLRGWTACRSCSQQLEFSVDGRALADGPTPADDWVAVGEHSYRLPTSRDLAAVAGEADGARATRQLLARCLATDAAPAWSEREVDFVGERLAEADPMAEILLQFDCPNCGAAYDEMLDLPSFLWAELEGRARGLLTEVDHLARAYGWSESQILALSPARRQVYLELAGA
jgi:hypothetical protein